MKIGVLVNPAAGRGHAAGTGEYVLAELKRRGAQVINVSADTGIASTSRGHDAAASGIDALLVVGGDGTVNLGVNAVAGLEVPLAIIPAGTGNDAARYFKIPRKANAAFELAWRNIRSGTSRQVDIAAVVLDSRPGVRWFLTAAAIGIDAAVTIRANGLRHLKGTLAYASAVLMELPAFTPYGYTLTFDDDPSTTIAATLVTIANTSTIGGGLKIAPGALATDGLLDIVIAEPMTPFQALRLFPRVYSGKHVTSKRVSVRQARTVKIAPADDVGMPPPALCVDGEVIGSLPGTVALHPGQLRLCC